MEFLKIYGCYIKMFLKARMEYRFSFYSGIMANFYCYFITYTTFWVIVKQFGSLDGWGFEDMSILYGLNLLTYSLAGMLFGYTVYHLDQEITSGNLDSYLMRPMGVIKQMICRRFGDTFIGQIIVNLIFMISAIVKINYAMTGLTYVYLALAVIGGFLIQAGAMIILGSLGFWMLRSVEFSNILYHGVRPLVHYPITVFPAWIRIALTYVLPWAIINYYPSLIILHKVRTAEELIIGLSSPLIGAAIFAVALFVFKQGLKRYSGSGS